MSTEMPGLARRAGLFYFLSSAVAPFAYLYVQGKMLVEGNAPETVVHVRAFEGLLRAAILGELFSATMIVFASLAFYRLFKGDDTAKLMAALMLVSVPISYVNALSNLAPLLLVRNPSGLDAGAQA